MNGVVDGIEVGFLSVGGNTHLVFVGTGLGKHTLVKVGLGVPYAVAQQFGELGSVFSFFPSVALEGFCDFRIAFAVGLTAHGEVHAHFGAFAHEMGVEVLYHFGVAAFGYTDFVFCHEFNGFFLGEFFEFALGGAAEGAFFGSFVTFVNITANCADEFLFHNGFW